MHPITRGTGSLTWEKCPIPFTAGRFTPSGSSLAMARGSLSFGRKPVSFTF
ncbi:MAG: hypothetical protein KJ620_08580 [Candidatus Edwardsbacteria bacterium]|nr:hypothetical protein [Candidatus Edwardsbacteria bacterium]